MGEKSTRHYRLIGRSGQYVETLWEPLSWRGQCEVDHTPGVKYFIATCRDWVYHEKEFVRRMCLRAQEAIAIEFLVDDHHDRRDGSTRFRAIC